MFSKNFKTWDSTNVIPARKVCKTLPACISIGKNGKVSFSSRVKEELKLQGGHTISFIQGIEEPSECFLYKLKAKESGIVLKEDKKGRVFFAGKAFGEALANQYGVTLPVKFRVQVAPEMPNVKGLPDVLFRCYINDIKDKK